MCTVCCNLPANVYGPHRNNITSIDSYRPNPYSTPTGSSAHRLRPIILTLHCTLCYTIIQQNYILWLLHQIKIMHIKSMILKIFIVLWWTGSAYLFFAELLYSIVYSARWVSMGVNIWVLLIELFRQYRGPWDSLPARGHFFWLQVKPFFPNDN